MPLAPIEVAVKWVFTMTGLTTIRREQLFASATRPDLPYCTVKIRSDQEIGLPTVRATDEAGAPPDDDKFLIKRGHFVQGILQVDAYGGDAVQTLRDLRRALRQEASRAVFGPENAIVTDPEGPVLDLAELRGTTWEPHAQQDFVIRFLEFTEEAIEDIQSVATDITYS